MSTYQEAHLSCEQWVNCPQCHSDGFPALGLVSVNPHIQEAWFQVCLKQNKKNKKWMNFNQFQQKSQLEHLLNKMCCSEVI